MRYVCPAILVAATIVTPIVLSAQSLSIINYQIVSQQTVTTGQWDLTCSAVLVNSGPALGSVTATLSSTNPFAIRALPNTSTLNFGPVSANGQVASSNTFTVMSSSTTFDPTQIQWTFQTTAVGPIANAGPNQTASVGSTVTLNGSGSTTPSGVLSYSWKFASRPAGTSSVLSNWTGVMPSFVVDVAGTYVITLTVSNGTQSSSANVTVSTTSTPPVANAGPNQTVSVGATALLNGSGSSDVDGNPLNFAWTMTSRPTGSTATLTGAATVSPSFAVDKAGSYTLQLIVKDGSLSSAPSTVTITSQNTPPVASAGTGQVVPVGTQVQLDGSGSSDTDGNALTYLWSLITVPSGSAAVLNSTAAAKPTFTADLAGTYIAQLIVNDGITNSSPATVTITTIAVLPPTANAGSNQTVIPGTVVALNGSGTDPQHFQLTYQWSLTTRPAGSSATLASATIANPTFSADLPGTYIAQLVVNNGTLSSTPTTVTITAAAPSGLQVPVNTVVAPGQTVSLNVTLGSPAPAGGLFVSLASSNTAVATVTAAFIIPGGAMAPTTTPKVNGIAFGSVTITATAVGFAPATGTVQVTETLTFSPSSLAIAGTTKGQLFLFVPQGAPAGGLTLSVSSSNTGVASVPSTVLIVAGATNVNVPVTGVSYGSTVIQASGPNVVGAMANVTVSAPVATGPPTIAAVTGTNQSAQINTAFSAPFVVVVKDSNSNPINGANVTFAATATAASGTFAGGATTAITNASGIATSALFSANGTVGIYYVSASVNGAVTPAAFYLTNVTAAPSGSPITTPPGTVGPAFVTHASAASVGNAASTTTTAINTTGCTPHCAIAVCYIGSTAGTPVKPVSDSVGNNYVLANSVYEGGDVITELWLAVGATTSATHTWTATGAGNAIATMLFSGVASGPDRQNQSGGYGTPNFTTGSITPTNPNEVVLSCAGIWGGGGYTVSPLTLVDTINYNGGYGGNGGIGTAYQIQTAATAVNSTWAVGGQGTATLIDSLYSTQSPAPLTLTSTSLAEGFKGTAYSYQLASSGGVCACIWTLTSGTLPTGLSMSTGGLISGTPTETIANVALTFKVTDSNTSTASSSALNLTIAATPVSITTTTCPTGTQYAAYSGCNIAAMGGTAPYTFSYSTSSNYAGLPEGMSLNSSTGAITSPQIGGQGTYGVDFVVTDANGATATKIIKFGLAGSNIFLTSIFPSNSIFHHRVDAASTGLPVDTSPAAPISPVYQSSALRVFFGNAPGGGGYTPNGIPVFEVPYNQRKVGVTTTMYQSYFTSGPFPANAPVEDTANCASCDRHVLIYQEAGSGNPAALWEMWQGAYSGTGPWSDSSNALWSNVATNALTAQGTGTSDAAGLPVAPLLLNADEVIGTGTPTSPNGTVQHPTRFTLNHMLNYWVWPATDTAGVGNCANSSGTTIATGTQISQSAPPSTCGSTTGPAGEIYRLKASVAAPACASTSPQANIIITGMRNYGIILADNGLTGGLIGTPDTRWVDSDLACLTQLTLSDFEPVNVSSLIVSNTSGQTLK